MTAGEERSAAYRQEFDTLDTSLRWLRAWLEARQPETEAALDVLSKAQDALAILNPDEEVGLVGRR